MFNIDKLIATRGNLRRPIEATVRNIASCASSGRSVCCGAMCAAGVAVSLLIRKNRGTSDTTTTTDPSREAQNMKIATPQRQVAAVSKARSYARGVVCAEESQMPGITELQQQRDTTALLKRWLGPAGVKLTNTQLSNVLGSEGIRWDADLAYTALTMFPRPGWVQQLAGKLECPDNLD